LGFDAHSGLWRVPPIPADLVVGNPLLEPLGDDVDSFWKPSLGASAEMPQGEVTRKQAAETPSDLDAMSPAVDVPSGSPSCSTAVSVAPPQARTLPDLAPDCTPEKECSAILAAVERAGGRIAKRLLQKKLWRIRAERFNQVIQSLVEQESIRVEGNMLMASRENENGAITGDGGI